MQKNEDDVGTCSYIFVPALLSMIFLHPRMTLIMGTKIYCMTIVSFAIVLKMSFEGFNDLKSSSMEFLILF